MRTHINVTPLDNITRRDNNEWAYNERLVILEIIILSVSHSYIKRTNHDRIVCAYCLLYI